MHNYLKSVGFSKIKKRKELMEILYDVIKNYDEKVVVENHEEGPFIEYSKYYEKPFFIEEKENTFQKTISFTGPNPLSFGISVCGQYDEDQKFHVEYYYPFFKGSGITTREKITTERNYEKESFAGACDDLRIGITLIFYLQNPARYINESNKSENFLNQKSVTLSGLAREGKILFPVMKDKEAVKVEQEANLNRTHLIEAARDGDEEAMENLTMEDMDTYSIISQRITTEDVLSIVDTYFMPYGFECDQYNVMGEIVDLSYLKNRRTNEEIVRMKLDSNDMRYDICINREDLLGEPEIGRRFKGIIWLQGQINY